MKMRKFLAGTAGTVVLATLGLGVAAYTASADTDARGVVPTSEIASELARTAPKEQQAALADGGVSLEEYNGAVEEAAKCAADRGIDVERRNTTPPSWGFAAPTFAGVQASQAILEACNAEHLDAIRTLWDAEHRPTAAQAAEAMQWVGACVREDAEVQGLPDVGGAASEATILGWLRSEDARLHIATLKCLGRVFDEFGFYL